MRSLSCVVNERDGVDRTSRTGCRARSEQAIGELAQALIDNPTLHNALSAAFGAREKAIEAQQAAMAALNLPSATDVERLERRLRSFSQRLEEVEEQIDDLGREVGDAAARGGQETGQKSQRLTLDFRVRVRSLQRRRPARFAADLAAASSSSSLLAGSALGDDQDGAAAIARPRPPARETVAVCMSAASTRSA